jgi:hypothetical protein
MANLVPDAPKIGWDNAGVAHAAAGSVLVCATVKVSKATAAFAALTQATDRTIEEMKVVLRI